MVSDVSASTCELLETYLKHNTESESETLAKSNTKFKARATHSNNLKANGALLMYVSFTNYGSKNDIRLISEPIEIT